MRHLLHKMPSTDPHSVNTAHHMSHKRGDTQQTSTTNWNDKYHTVYTHMYIMHFSCIHMYTRHREGLGNALHNRCYRTCTDRLEWHSFCFTDACTSSGTQNSRASLTNLFKANPSVMVVTALCLWVDLTSNHSFTLSTLALATASFGSFHCSSLKPSWIRREHGRSKSHYHIQDSPLPG